MGTQMPPQLRPGGCLHPRNSMRPFEPDQQLQAAQTADGEAFALEKWCPEAAQESAGRGASRRCRLMARVARREDTKM
jgi:hypothetical protein